jgi:hypothetical protein
MRRRAFALLVLSLAECRAQSSASADPDRGPKIDLSSPGCIAWSPRTSHFACVELVATPVPEGVQDLTSPSMAKTLELVLRTDASIALGIVDVGTQPHESGAWPQIAGIDLQLTGTAANAQLDGLRMLLGARGFDVPLVETLVLEPTDEEADGVGTSEARSELTGLEFRYGYDLHEGDASFEYTGTLTVRCNADSAPRVVFDDLGGPFARIGIADGGRWAVISVEHQDGGEGYVDVVWYHQAFALDQLCP